MGKVRIVSGGTEGLYQVEVLHNRERIDAELSALQAKTEELAPQITESETALEYAELEVQEATITVNALIDQLEQDGDLSPVDLARLVDLHNGIRAGRGIGTLTALGSLNAAAQAHADWLATVDVCGHTGSGGSTPRQRILQAGYSGATGENVACGPLPTEDDAIAAWMNSPGHRSNILSENFEHIGTGYACRSGGSFRRFWVVVFGSGGSGAAASPAAPGNCAGQDADEPELIREAIEKLAEAAAERSKKNLAHTQLVAQDLTLRQRIEQLQAIPDDPTQSAWCADYTENLSGNVASIEIPGEGNERVIVRPGYSGRATYTDSRDGQLFHRHGMTGAQAFLNAALLPGWQRWMPTYRVGSLTAVDKENDTGTVALDLEQSSAQDLSINQSSSLEGIDIVYMNCNADAFEVGDRVVVEFVGQDWGAARVIGFESNPVSCFEWPDIFVAIQPSLGSYAFGPAGSVNFLTEWRWQTEQNLVGLVCPERYIVASFTNEPTEGQRDVKITAQFDSHTQDPATPVVSIVQGNIDLFADVEDYPRSLGTLEPKRFIIQATGSGGIFIQSTTLPVFSVSLTTVSNCSTETGFVGVWGGDTLLELFGQTPSFDPPTWSDVSSRMVDYNTPKFTYDEQLTTPEQIRAWAIASGAPSSIPVTQDEGETNYDLLGAVYTGGRWRLRYGKPED